MRARKLGLQQRVAGLIPGCAKAFDLIGGGSFRNGVGGGMRGRTLLPSLAYLLPAAAQGLLGFLVVATVARVLGTPGLATWGLQLLVFQLLSLMLSLGLPGVVAAQSVRIDGQRARSEQYGAAMGAILVTSLAAVSLLLARDVVLGSSVWPYVAAAAGMNAMAQTLTANLRGLERHLTNSLVLTLTWVFGYGAGIVAVVATQGLTAYWVGVLCGTAVVLGSGVVATGSTGIRRPRNEDLALVKTGLLALPHSTGNFLMTGLLRPIAGWFAGPPGVAAMTVATQFAQVAVVAHQAYWANHMPLAIRASASSSDEQLRRLGRRSAVAMLALWAGCAVAAPAVIRILAGDETTSTMVVLSLLMCGLPLASTVYDLYSGTLWRASRTSVLSTTTMVALLLMIVSALVFGSLCLAALPLGLLLARILQGLLVRRAVRSSSQ